MKYLIVGLGNIGPEYANTRHNVGFKIADAIAEDAQTPFATGRYGDMAKIKYRSRTLLVIKPSTYMNLSGNAIKYWLNKESIPLEHLLVIVDDLALPLGELRLRAKGGDGGHNGLISIFEQLGTPNYARLRVGIGDEFSKGHQVNYVLGEWLPEEYKIVEDRFAFAVKIVKSFCTIGISRTMNTFNTRPPKKSSEKKAPDEEFPSL
ncbi:MAG: aminoacyl-tRNA hydrolase [Bacteroidales bacterium]|nr:aminoacyl-tRNA hydrolase [Bacteroidales bacterium]